jgi:esterase/lipase superfamily enzyme
MGLTLKDRREKIQLEREVIRSLQFDLVRIRAAIKQSRGFIKQHRAVIAEERKFARLVKQDNRALRRAKQIAKMEARLAALKAAA